MIGAKIFPAFSWLGTLGNWTGKPSLEYIGQTYWNAVWK